MSPPRTTRRALLGSVATGALLGTAGCLQTLGFQRQSAWRDPPLAEDRPDAVYVPAVIEGMETYGKTNTGRYGVALTYSYPHRFWTLSGTETSKTVVEADDDVHLMVSLWDTETGRVLPLDSGVTIEILDTDGTLVTEEVAYPMLSQTMGFHYGANYALDGEGEYEARVHVGGVSLRRTGGFAGAFESAATVTIPFTFETDELHSVSIMRPKNAGVRDAAMLMEMDGVPAGRAPTADSLPGQHLGAPTLGDAVFQTFLVAGDSERFGSEPYLYVSARTPYNRFVLPMMGLEATLTRGGETVFESRLTRTLDPDLGYHYGASVAEFRSGDELTITTTIPPQVARHDGYETAFREMGDVSMTVE
ncbi:iron transporter [Halobellus inordinatus]|uniref:iron transporter n=1 Tax=Halobellus inordinatus TaxID=1126236 RepID=UPI002108A4C5|nr:iron transporter [Halobellus inordinatus]